MRWLAALAGVCLLGGCSTTSRQTVVIPTDGVHMTGAVNAIYPITNGGTCPYVGGRTGKQLMFSAAPVPGTAYVGAVIENFTGPRTYTNVQWPPQGHSALYAAVGDRTWRAESGLISVKEFGGGKASGTLWASHLREANGSTTVNVAGSWTCRILLPPPPEPSPSPLPSPSPSPIVFPNPSPSHMGTPVVRRILPPATVLPVVALCSAPIQKYADGGAGPLFCGTGSLIVEAWTYYAPVVPHLLSLGPNPTVTAVESAFCADGRELHATNPMLLSGYELAAAYYAWNLTFDPEKFILSGTCP